MTAQYLLRQLARTREASQMESWDDPRWDQRWTVTDKATEAESMDLTPDYGFIGLVTLGAFVGQLRAAAASGEVRGPVRVTRIYQCQDGDHAHGDYAVYAVAYFDLVQPGKSRVRIELRIHCGEQDLDQETELALPSRQAQRFIDQVALACRVLELECTSANFGEHRR